MSVLTLKKIGTLLSTTLFFLTSCGQSGNLYLPVQDKTKNTTKTISSQQSSVKPHLSTATATQATQD